MNHFINKHVSRSTELRKFIRKQLFPISFPSPCQSSALLSLSLSLLLRPTRSLRSSLSQHPRSLSLSPYLPLFSLPRHPNLTCFLAESKASTSLHILQKPREQYATVAKAKLSGHNYQVTHEGSHARCAAE